MHKISPQVISIMVFVLGLAAMVVVGVLGYQKWAGDGQGQSGEARQTQGTIERLTAGAQGLLLRFGEENFQGRWESETTGENGAGKTTFITYEENGIPAYDLYFLPRDPSLPVYFVRGTYEYDKEMDELVLTPRQDMGMPANHTARTMEHLGLRPYTVKIRKGKGDSMIWAAQKPRGHINRAHPIFVYMQLPQNGEILWQRPER